MRRILRSFRLASMFMLLACFSAGATEAGTSTIEWDPSAGPDLAGYIVSWGTSPGEYSDAVDVSDQTSFQFQAPDPTRVSYFAVQAYDTTGFRGAFSEEVTIGPTNPSVLAPPMDPAGRKDRPDYKGRRELLDRKGRRARLVQRSSVLRI